MPSADSYNCSFLPFSAVEMLDRQGDGGGVSSNVKACATGVRFGAGLSMGVVGVAGGTEY